MILLEQHIELMIYHNNVLRKFNAIEILSDTEGMSFKIFDNKEYMFTLIPFMNENLSFELSDYDKQHTVIDWALYSKITASLYSVFLKEPIS